MIYNSEAIDHTPVAVTLPAYGRVKVQGGDTIALLSGNIPHVVVMLNSHAVPLKMGNSIPVPHHQPYLCNPFPREIQFVYARGLSPRYSNDTGLSLEMQTTVYSGIGVLSAAVATGQKYAVGMMMRKGAALLEVYEAANDQKSSVMIFPGAQADFISKKPAGAMTDQITLYHQDGFADQAVNIVSGRYVDADVTAWVAAAGYTRQPTIVRHSAFFDNVQRFQFSEDTAIFWVREANAMAQAYLRVIHLGLGLEAHR